MQVYSLTGLENIKLLPPFGFQVIYLAVSRGRSWSFIVRFLMDANLKFDGMAFWPHWMELRFEKQGRKCLYAYCQCFGHAVTLHEEMGLTRDTRAKHFFFKKRFNIFWVPYSGGVMCLGFPPPLFLGGGVSKITKLCISCCLIVNKRSFIFLSLRRRSWILIQRSPYERNLLRNLIHAGRLISKFKWCSIG